MDFFYEPLTMQSQLFWCQTTNSFNRSAVAAPKVGETSERITSKLRPIEQKYI